MPLQASLVEVLVVAVAVVVVLQTVGANTTEVTVVLVGQLLLIIGESAVNGVFSFLVEAV